MKIELSNREIQTIINSLEKSERELQISAARCHKTKKYEEVNKCMDKLSSIANILVKMKRI